MMEENDKHIMKLIRKLHAIFMRDDSGNRNEQGLVGAFARPQQSLTSTDILDVD